MNGVFTEGRNIYSMTLIDDFTRYFYVYLSKTNDEAVDFFKINKVEVKNGALKRVQFDHGGEYFSNEFNFSIWSIV
jgi:hypothetical protein